MSFALSAARLALGASFAATAAAAPAKPYGILLLSYDSDASWRQELGQLRRRFVGVPLESVESAADAVSVQRALDRLLTQHVGKVVGVPVETITSAPWLEKARYLFGATQKTETNAPGVSPGDAADRVRKPLISAHKSTLTLPSDAQKRLVSSVPLILGPAMDRSAVLADILADRARALSRDPKKDVLILVGIAPRADDELTAWKADAQKIVDAVKKKAGFRAAALAAVREGVRSDQREKDRAELDASFRALRGGGGRIVVVPLSPQTARVDQMLKRALGGRYAYVWDGRGVHGDARLPDWIAASATAAAKKEDGRKFKDDAFGASTRGLR